MNRLKIAQWTVIIGLPCLALGIFGFSGYKNAGTDGAPAPEPIRPVKAIRLKAPEITDIRSFPGSARAAREVNLAFRVPGPLVTLNGETGDRVEKGDLIARIDSRDFNIRIKSLEANLKASRAQLVQSGLQYDRYIHLVKEDAAAKATFDRVEATFEMAKARVDADIKSLESARNALSDTVLTAPFTGYINKKWVENHENVTQGQPIISLVDLSRVEVAVGIPGNLTADLGRYNTYICEFETIPGQTFTATFRELGKKPNPSNQTYPLTLVLDRAESDFIRPGMSARVSITFSRKDPDTVFRVPVHALVNGDQGKTYVWIVNETDRTVRKKYVQTAGLNPAGIAVRGELNAGDWLVTAGVNFLKEGQVTRILEAATRTNVGNAL